MTVKNLIAERKICILLSDDDQVSPGLCFSEPIQYICKKNILSLPAAFLANMFNAIQHTHTHIYPPLEMSYEAERAEEGSTEF